MKKTLPLVLLSLCISGWCFSQITTLSKSDKTSESEFDLSHISYEIIGKCFIHPYNENTDDVDEAISILSPANSARFDVIGMDSNKEYIIIYFPKWTGGTDMSALNATYGDKFFAISKENIQLRSRKLFAKTWSAEFGILSIPFKLRFNPFTYSKDISIDATASAKYRISKRNENYVSILGGLGITSVTMDSASTYRISGADTLYNTNNRNSAAFSFVLGAVFEFNKVQIGVFTGLDALGGADGDIWRYQGQPFLAIGIGLSLFTVSTSNNKPSKSGN